MICWSYSFIFLFLRDLVTLSAWNNYSFILHFQYKQCCPVQKSRHESVMKRCLTNHNQWPCTREWEKRREKLCAMPHLNSCELCAQCFHTNKHILFLYKRVLERNSKSPYIYLIPHHLSFLPQFSYMMPTNISFLYKWVLERN